MQIKYEQQICWERLLLAKNKYRDYSERREHSKDRQRYQAVVKNLSLRHSWIFHALPLCSSWRGLMQFSCIRVLFSFLLSLFIPSTADFESMRVCVRSLDPFPKSSIKNLTQATVLVTVAVNSTPSHQFKLTIQLKMQCNPTTQ